MLTDDKENILTPGSEDNLKKIQKAAYRLTQMVEGVLGYSQIKNFNEAAEEIALAEVLATIEIDLELLILEKQALIEYGSFPLFRGVQFLIFQLFYNLINNALKFSRPGIQPVITITHRIIPGDSGNAFIEISVADNGIGFDPKYSETIFNTFTRLHSKNQYEGTGLGLALCKNIAEKHGGSIRAESREQGSAFIVTFPF
jgi:light-regulated signal transduction histidine kinase (bacteriophytochrome)